MSEHDANQHLIDTARMRAAAEPDLESTQRMPVCLRRRRATEGAAMVSRERRKPETVGERKAAVQYARDIIADRQQEMIEAGIWPVY